MRRVLILALPLFALALSACGNMGGHRADEDAMVRAAFDARLASQEAQTQEILAELRATREAAEAATLAATPPLPEPELPDGVEDTGNDGEGETDTGGGSAGAPEAVVVTTVEDTVPVETVAMPLADNSSDGSGANVVGFAAEDRAKTCVTDLMKTGADVDRPTSAVKAAYVCSHLYGLDHDRGLETQNVSHSLTLDGKAFTAGLEQRKAKFQHVLDLDSGNDGDYPLGRGFSVLPASLTAGTE